MLQSITETCAAAKAAAKIVAGYSAVKKNAALEVIKNAVLAASEQILSANAADLEAAVSSPAHFLDRLRLTGKRISDIAAGVDAVIALPDPIGNKITKWNTETGLQITKVSAPLGVVGIIYEARPNVTVDCIALCVKSGNAVVLRGSKDAINSNIAIVKAIKTALEREGFGSGYIQLIEDTTREGAETFMRQNKLIDVLLPRGSAGLIRTVVETATVPVIETGVGNCHIYVEKTADYDMAEKILLNAKLQRPSVCNAAESLLIHSDIADSVLPKLCAALTNSGVEVRGCKKTCALVKNAKPAGEEDFAAEYNALIISVKVVKNTAEAIDHINKYGSGHSDAIITENAAAAQRFLKEVDSAAVYVNASTRFTDGYEFGFGAEMGISTQKLHARGPVGLKELTSYKYCVKGTGQVRG